MRFFSVVENQNKDEVIEEQEVHDVEIADQIGWNSNDRWTTMLRDIENQDKPKVNFYQRKRETYYKLGYNENHLPN